MQYSNRQVSKCNIPTDKSDASKSIQNNSQWQSGTVLGPITLKIPPGTQPPPHINPALPLPPINTDQANQTGDETEDEGGGEGGDEGEGEAFEEIDDFDALDGHTLETNEEASLWANNQWVGNINTSGAAPSLPMFHTTSSTDVEQLLPDENSVSEDEDLDIPDQEEMSAVGQTDQQTVEGNE